MWNEREVDTNIGTTPPPLKLSQISKQIRPGAFRCFWKTFTQTRLCLAKESGRNLEVAGVGGNLHRFMSNPPSCHGIFHGISMSVWNSTTMGSKKPLKSQTPRKKQSFPKKVELLEISYFQDCAKYYIYQHTSKML